MTTREERREAIGRVPEHLRAMVMTPGQRAAIVASTQDWSKAQAVGQPGKVSGKIARLNTRADRAAVSGVGDGTQKMADDCLEYKPNREVEHDR